MVIFKRSPIGLIIVAVANVGMWSVETSPMKRVLLHLIVLLCGASWVIAATSGAWTYALDPSNKATVTAYRGAGGAVTIPSSIDGFVVTTIGRAFRGCDALTRVEIPNSVTTIWEFAFIGCSSLTSVTIGNGVTSIGNRAFESCSSLTNITLPQCFDGKLKDIGCDANKVNVTFTDSASGPKTSTDWAYTLNIEKYSGAGGAVEIPPNIDGRIVTIIGDDAFKDCSSLTGVTIPDGVTSIGNNAFQDCSALTSVTIPPSVTSIGNRAFQDCSALTSVTIPRRFANKLREIGFDARKVKVTFTN
jgi:hypothetical protein